MFITGIDGSGKSHVIKAIVALFKCCGCRENLLLSAPTGCATVLIDGYTIHALTFLPGGDKLTKQANLEVIWAKVCYLILDEISMVSAELLYLISERISLAKKGTLGSEGKPFAGINVIFTGDLGQLRPVGCFVLYAADLLRKLETRTKETPGGHRGLFGALIWQQLTHIVELKKNIRAGTDPEFVALLSRIRAGTRTATTGDGLADYNALKAWCIEKLELDRPTEWAELQTASVIFGTRCLRDLFNQIKAKQFAADTDQEYHEYLAVDKINKQPIEGEERVRLSYVRIKESKEAMGRLPLIPGIKVMITENLSMGNKIVNRSEGILMDIVFKETCEGREAICAYVTVTTSSIAIEGLSHTVVPIFSKTVHFTYQPSQGQSIRINRCQLLLIPAWAFTDYKVQGASLPAVIVDLASVRGIENVYVMLSRAPSMAKLGILRWFPSHCIFSRLQEDLRTELARISHLDSRMREWFHNQHYIHNESQL